MKSPEQVILVDENDNQTGVTDKMEAHQHALLHRAVSVFVFNKLGEWLLQRRADEKYHSGGLWSNACCTHPFPGESVEAAAHRRLREEMGMDCELKFAFSFVYKEQLDNELTEHEFDHVFFGFTDALPELNPDEVQDFRYISLFDLENDMTLDPENYTVWFRMIANRVGKHLQSTGL